MVDAVRVERVIGDGSIFIINFGGVTLTHQLAKKRALDFRNFCK